MDYLQEPKIPTSTEVRYIVQAFVRGELVYETDTKNLQVRNKSIKYCH